MSPRWYLVVFLVVLLISVQIELTRFPANHDVTGVMDKAERVLAGEKLYIDLPEMNPPLCFYLEMIPIRCSQLIGISPITGNRFFIIFLALFSIYLCRRVSKTCAFFPQACDYQILSLFQMALFLVFAGYFDGEREHLTVIFLLPWILLSAGVANQAHLEPPLSYLVGAFAAPGLCMKPLFSPLWAVYEIYLFLVSPRETYRFWRPENRSIVLFSALYAVWICLGTNYIPFILYAKDFYAGFETTWADIFGRLHYAGPMISIVYVVFCPKPRSIRHLTNFLVLGILLFLGSYLLQKKGWGYHAIPMQMLGIHLTLILILATRAHSESGLSFRSRLASALRPFAVFFLFVYFWAYSTPLWHNHLGILVENYAQTIRKLVQNRKIHFLGTSVFPLFPTMYYLGIRTTQTDSPWILAKIYSGIEPVASHFPYDQRPEYDALKNTVRSKSIADLRHHEPSLIISEKHAHRPGFASSSFDFIEFLKTDASFAGWFDTHYHYATSTSEHQLFVYNGS